jgi:hypothetical protein
MALNRRSWLPVAVIVALALFIGMLGLFIWVVGNHNALASNLSGTWFQPAGHQDAELTIGEDPRSHGVGFLAPDLACHGTIDGQTVRGKIKLPTFPPWRSSVEATFLGRAWTMAPSTSPHALTLLSSKGRTITFTERR